MSLLTLALACYLLFGLVAGVLWFFLGPNWAMILHLRPRRRDRERDE